VTEEERDLDWVTEMEGLIEIDGVQGGIEDGGFARLTRKERALGASMTEVT